MIALKVVLAVVVGVTMLASVACWATLSRVRWNVRALPLLAGAICAQVTAIWITTIVWDR